MRAKRALTIDNYNTAFDGGMTLHALQVDFPKVYTSTVTVPGMDGVLDYTEAAAGRPTYGNRMLKATLECSKGTRQERQAVFDEFTSRFHGQRCKIRLPDEERKYLIGRVSIKKMTNLIPYGSIELEADCEPWRYSDPPCIQALPIAKTTDNAIYGTESLLLDDLSDASSATLSAGSAATFPVVVVGGARECRAVWELSLAPDTEYLASGRISQGRGIWTVATSVDASAGSRGFIRTGSDGKLYLCVEKHSDIDLRLSPLYITPVDKLDVLHVGAANALASVSVAGTPAALEKARSVAVVTGEYVSVQDVSHPVQFTLRSGNQPAICYALTADISTTLRWTRGDL